MVAFTTDVMEDPGYGFFDEDEAGCIPHRMLRIDKLVKNLTGLAPLFSHWPSSPRPAVPDFGFSLVHPEVRPSTWSFHFQGLKGEC